MSNLMVVAGCDLVAAVGWAGAAVGLTAFGAVVAVATDAGVGVGATACGTVVAGTPVGGIVAAGAPHAATDSRTISAASKYKVRILILLLLLLNSQCDSLKPIPAVQSFNRRVVCLCERARLERRAGYILLHLRRESRLWFGIVKVRQKIFEERLIVGITHSANFALVLDFDPFPVPDVSLTYHRTQGRVAIAAVEEQQISTGSRWQV
jgi:hypothetical protein